MPVDKSQMSEVRILSKSSCDLPESDLEETLTVAESTSLPILPTKESGAFSIDKVILIGSSARKIHLCILQIKTM